MSEQEKKHVIFITSYLGRFNGKDYKERGGIYGSELACISVAMRLTKWYKVTIFVTDDVDLVEDDVRYVRWGHYEKVCNECKPDICVVSRFINFFVYNTNYAKQTYIWSHDTFLHPLYQQTSFPAQGAHLLRNLLPVIDKVICVGSAQRDHFYIEREHIPPEKVCFIPNGVNLRDKMNNLDSLIKQKKKNSFVFCSSPDRFLNVLLKVFPRITELLPDATLDIYYADIPDDCKELAKNQSNVTCKGKVAQEKLMDILCRTEYWCYPTKFFETCCTVSYETAYAGCIRITSEVGAMVENVKGTGITIPGDPDSPAFQDQLIETLKYLTENPQMKRKVLERQHRWAKEQTWDNRGDTWHQLFEEGHAKYVNKNCYKNYMIADDFPSDIVDLRPYETLKIPENPSITPGERRRFFKNLENPENWAYLYALQHCEWYRLLNEFLESSNEFVGLLPYGETSENFEDLYINLMNEFHKRSDKNQLHCVLVSGKELADKKFVYIKECDKSELVSRTSIILSRKGAQLVIEEIDKNGFTDYLWNVCYDMFGKHKLVTEKNFLTIKMLENKKYYKPFGKLPAEIGCAIMMKDEERLIHLSLESTIDYVNSYIFFDTGSTDRTIEICEEFCKKHNVPMYLKRGTFVDFSVSRNELLRFADDKADYLLLLDSGDELRNGPDMWQSVIKEGNEKAAWYCGQNWSVGGGRGIEYRNIRFIKTKMEWAYEYPVHEYIAGPHCNEKEVGDSNIVVFQDRTLDQGKSKKRWERDRIILLKELRKKKNDGRVVFYLGQTYRCLEMYDSAATNFLKRIDMNHGFHDENQQAFIELYNISKHIPQRISRSKAMDLLKDLWKRYKRGEGAFYLAKEYMVDKNWKEAWTWVCRVCELGYPTHIKLWVDNKIYSHHRWQLKAIIGLNLGDEEKKEGFEALKVALNDEPSDSISQTILREYQKRGFKF